MKYPTFISNFQKNIPRRKFLQLCLSGAALLTHGKYLKAYAQPAGSNGRKTKPIQTNYDLVAVKGEDPAKITIEAIKAMGGMEKFVKKGSTVVIKPNIGWDRTPNQASNTNPEVVAALVTLCYLAGAKRVNVFDVTCNSEKRCYENSGIQKAALDSGAKVYFADTWNVVNAKFDYESPMQDWPILRDAIECDTFINVPVAKHHRLTRLTLSMKNLMGVCGGDRGNMHQNIGRKIVDLTDFIKPDLTIIDAYRVLVRNGPFGGNLEDVEMKNTVLASTDPTLADTYACKLMDVDPMDVLYLKEAKARNFGNHDLDKANIKRFNI